jgi:DNA topoisomerase-1
MAKPGPDGPPEPSHNKRHYRKEHEQAEQATTTMTDQQNYEATRPVSADPAVALAEALARGVSD